MVKYLLPIGILLFGSWSCDHSDSSSNNIKKEEVALITNEVITSIYSGNGAQWGGYDIISQWTGNPTLSEEDWEKLFSRVRFMDPGIVRIMISPGWNYMIDGKFAPEKSNDILVKILDFCEQENIAVMFGEWGHSGGDTIDFNWMDYSIQFLNWLYNTKGFSCIKYMTIVNEPNGDWSSTNGNYELWSNLLTEYHSRMEEVGLASEIKLTGPDIAIWDTNTIWWMNNTVQDLDGKLGAYDIHTYPSASQVRNGEYLPLISAYRTVVPKEKEVIMGELGFKYAASSDLGKENAEKISNDPFASDDSNMFIYDAFYGIDMADAVIQNMIAGFSGVVVWNMDDAMYNIDGGSSTKLKRWGFWNILGEEKFENPEDENIRPWFYTMSLMSRYFPRGCSVLKIEVPEKKGLRAVAAKLGDKYSIAIVNSHYVDYHIQINSKENLNMEGVKKYKFLAGEGAQFYGNVDNNYFPIPIETNLYLSIDETKGIELDVPARSFILFSNLDK